MTAPAWLILCSRDEKSVETQAYLSPMKTAPNIPAPEMLLEDKSIVWTGGNDYLKKTAEWNCSTHEKKKKEKHTSKTYFLKIWPFWQMVLKIAFLSHLIYL